MTDSRRLRLNPQHKDRLKRLVECWTLEEARVVIPDYRTDVNQVVDNEGRTALHVFASIGQLEIGTLLLEARAEVNKTNERGDSSLQTALFCGNIEMVRLLLQWNADVNQANNQGETSLYRVANAPTNPNNLELARLLLESNAKVNKSNRWLANPLYAAVDRKNLEMVKLLVKWDAAVDQAANDGITPIRLAGILVPCLRYRASNEVESQAMKHMLEIIRILKASGPISLRLIFMKFLFGYKLQMFEPSAIADSGLPNSLTRTLASLDALPSLPHRDMIFLTQHRYTDIIAKYVG